jgi:hypothetical protein
VVIDPIEFELALINLGINARDAMRDGGRIRFGARNIRIPLVDRRALQRSLGPDKIDRRGPRLTLPAGDYVAITIGDTGGGMDEATLARAVEPFFTTKPAGEGTGLGLSAAHTLATQAGGALRLLSEVGRGTTVEMWLPRAPVRLPDRGRTRARSDSGRRRGPPLRSGRPARSACRWSEVLQTPWSRIFTDSCAELGDADGDSLEWLGDV